MAQKDEEEDEIAGRATLELPDIDDAELMDRKLKTSQATKNVAAVRQRRMEKAKNDAKAVATAWGPKRNKNVAEEKDPNSLVWIRAMKSHTPAPKVGDFSFESYYTEYVEAIRYLVPRYVADALEESENALSLG